MRTSRLQQDHRPLRSYIHMHATHALNVYTHTGSKHHPFRLSSPYERRRELLNGRRLYRGSRKSIFMAANRPRGAAEWSATARSDTAERSLILVPFTSESSRVLKSISRLHDLAPCSSWAPRARNDALVGRRVNGGRRLSRHDAWFYEKD